MNSNVACVKSPEQLVIKIALSTARLSSQDRTQHLAQTLGVLT